MRTSFIRILPLVACCFGILAGSARADVCVVVDEAHDTFEPLERTAAVAIALRQADAAGEHGVEAPCPKQYTLSHVRLGETIVVTLAGPQGRREAIAIGLDDLPAVYNQMFRSILTGRPMTLGGVVDRTNVSAAQTDRLRVGSDSIFYTRLGYGAIFSDRTHGVPSVGILGYRHELERFGIDVSFLNFGFQQSYESSGLYSSSTGASSASWVKLEGLYFKRPAANQSAYLGGGLSWGHTSQSDANRYWDGSGLQGELTVGYEMARASTIRVFVAADAGLPFYSLTSNTYTRTGVTTSHRYAPSLVLSLGLGWQRGGHGRR